MEIQWNPRIKKRDCIAEKQNKKETNGISCRVDSKVASVARNFSIKRNPKVQR